MTIKKEIKKVFRKLTGKNSKKSAVSMVCQQNRIPDEVILTDIVTAEDYEKNARFIEKMRQHKFKKMPESFLCFLPYTNQQSGFLSGGYGTIMSLNNALSVIFNAEIYLCFFPVVADKTMKAAFAAGVEKCYPKMKFKIVDYDDVFSLNVDVAMCNFWLGAYPLLKFNNCKEKYNLIQDHEAMFYNDTVAALAEQTLSFGFYKLCNSQALKNYTEFVDDKALSFRYFPGVDHNLYYPTVARKNKDDVCKIIFYGRPSIPRNAFGFLVPVLQRVKKELGNRVQIISVGENYDTAAWNLQGVVENYGRLNNPEQLAELYRQCDIGISLITTPTFSYQHLEFMASGLCLVTNRQAGIQDFWQDNVNSAVCEMNVSIMARRIIELVNHPEDIQRISAKAVEATKKLDWETCYREIADFIMRDKTKNG